MNSNFRVTKTKHFSVFDVNTLEENKLAPLTEALFPFNRDGKVDYCSEKVREAIEPYVEKCRISRKKAQQSDLENYDFTPPLHDFSFLSSVKETKFFFSSKKYPIADQFAELVGLHKSDLPYLHNLYNADNGKKGNRAEKKKFLTPLLDKQKRQTFHKSFIQFALEVVAPHFAASYEMQNENNSNCLSPPSCLLIQSFPCVRVVRPREFSLGIHSDCSYGFQQSTVNYWIPLTSVEGTNSLVIESYPNLEDWHDICINNETNENEVSCGIRFWGSMCSHFAAENTQSTSRVSLDLRVIDGRLFIENHDHFSVHKKNMENNGNGEDGEFGYFMKCVFVEDEESKIKSEINNMKRSGKWQIENGIIPEPDWRNGFPFVK